MADPTPSELEILHILWQHGECKVQIVNDELNKLKPVGYTTTLKIMQIMTEKGLVDRKKDGKSHIYFPLVQQSTTQTSLLDKLISAAFNGSKAKLVMQILGSKDISTHEMDEIKKFLTEMEKKDD